MTRAISLLLLSVLRIPGRGICATKDAEWRWLETLLDTGI